jgi:twitching motility protein PilT
MIKKFVNYNNGLVLITGSTGSGKSTTIASLLEYINQNQKKHIITVEDPIEFVFQSKKSFFTQRQISLDTDSFPDGIKYALRQNPDIVLVGEMRDKETVTSAIKAAETGHMVFSTLHTNDAIQTINRIINLFEPHQREYITIQLANVLRGSNLSKMLPRQDGNGRVPAVEVLTVTPAVKNYMLKDQIDDVYEQLRIGSQNDMLSLNNSLYKLAKSNLVSEVSAIHASENQNELRQMLRGAYTGSQR